ncbi:hypothetical protein EI94DRAFT_1255963 [Lactarius quietus]|nr:hypothetical protein EI94DRAFT_1255963 [Lactarius quietus]
MLIIVVEWKGVDRGVKLTSSTRPPALVLSPVFLNQSLHNIKPSPNDVNATSFNVNSTSTTVLGRKQMSAALNANSIFNPIFLPAWVMNARSLLNKKSQTRTKSMLISSHAARPCQSSQLKLRRQRSAYLHWVLRLLYGRRCTRAFIALSPDTWHRRRRHVGSFTYRRSRRIRPSCMPAMTITLLDLPMERLGPHSLTLVLASPWRSISSKIWVMSVLEDLATDSSGFN